MNMRVNCLIGSVIELNYKCDYIYENMDVCVCIYILVRAKPLEVGMVNTENSWLFMLWIIVVLRLRMKELLIKNHELI